MLEQEQVKKQRRTIVQRQKLVAAIFLLAGVLCLAGVGIYFYGRSQANTVREYDGVLVWEKQEERA
ncbi:MAG: hypothetical protein HFI40_03585 [Lachnospiraceae bacterium]|jgi:hypothetical protein|nr:hypothetical protein [Lachnospiraceae bacterium]MCX4317408.1 hypothetical protein [Lachnospiraceae bacterium]